MCRNHRIWKREPVKGLLSRLSRMVHVLVMQNSLQVNRKLLHNGHRMARLESGVFMIITCFPVELPSLGNFL
jgi:hypothetical protein